MTDARRKEISSPARREALHRQASEDLRGIVLWYERSLTFGSIALGETVYRFKPGVWRVLPDPTKCPR